MPSLVLHNDIRIVGCLSHEQYSQFHLPQIAAFCRDFAPDDVVTCVDRDWGDGSGWQSIGFDRVSVMPPLVMVVGEDGVRRYLVGAGIGSKTDPNPNRNGRPGISTEVFEDLNRTIGETEAVECVASHNLYPVYDAGVERRILLIRNNKMESHALVRRQELDLEDLGVPSDLNALELWASSTPSFPNEYYSQNSGINSLLERAQKKVQENPTQISQ